MESAIQTMVKVFLKSTKGKESLGKGQFQGLVKNQLSNILSDTDSKEAVNNMGQGLDADHDGKVGFEEYLKLVGYLAVSLSEQRTVAKEEPAQNAASGQVAQSAQGKEEEVKPEANNAEVKEEAKPEANEEPKVEAVAGIKVDESVMKVEIKSGGETQIEAAKEEEKPAAAAAAEAEAAAPAAAVVAAASEVAAAATEEAAAAVPVEVVVKGVEEKDETEKLVEGAENLAATVQDDIEKKTEEATS